MRKNGSWCVRDGRGFTMVELTMVIAVMGTIAAIAILVSPAMMEHAKAESGIAQAVATLRTAREGAIAQRRNFMIEFVGLTGIRISRQEIGANGVPAGTTVLGTIELENRMQIRLQPGLPDTPDGFGNASAVNFGSSPQRMFTSEGTLVNQQGDVVNGTVFFSIPGDLQSARAVSIFGPTALVRVWRWDGKKWVD